MLDTLGVVAIVGVIVIILLGAIFWFRKTRQTTTDSIIELEKLVNCRSCGSLVPEGVRKCAFCGAWQHQNDAKEGGPGHATNP